MNMYQLPNKNWTNVYWGYRDTGGFVTRTRLRSIGMFCLVDPRPMTRVHHGIHSIDLSGEHYPLVN